MDNTNPAGWTDEYMARWMAERDGWRNLYIQDFHGEQILMGDHDKCADMFGPYPGNVPDYPSSLDAAVGWLGRMGLEWCRVTHSDGGFYVLVWRASNYQCYGETKYESPTCPTARALCNAGAAAVMARKAGNV